MNKKTVLHTPWFEVESEIIEQNINAKKEPYYRIKAPDSVVILAITNQNEIVLVRQYRPAIEKVTWELPAGCLNKGESPIEAAQRELAEETGYKCPSLELIGAGRIMMNRFANRLYGFLGRGAERINSWSATEDIEVVTFSWVEFKKLLNQGEFEQIASLGFLFMACWKTKDLDVVLETLSS